jgi:molybdopterin adenylyltransferase
LTRRAAVITVSTSKAAAQGEDESGPRLTSLLSELGLDVVGTEIVADDREQIAERLRHWADSGDCALVATTGGTGLSPTDVTPEATLDVIEREAPGVAEAMRLASRSHTRHWLLSRARAGTRGSTLIVNFPGNPDAVAQTIGALAEALPHALDLIAGEHPDHN